MAIFNSYVSLPEGRYNELVHGGFIVVYKPTNITGGAHPVGSLPILFGNFQKLC